MRFVLAALLCCACVMPRVVSPVPSAQQTRGSEQVVATVESGAASADAGAATTFEAAPMSQVEVFQEVDKRLGCMENELGAEFATMRPPGAEVVLCTRSAANRLGVQLFDSARELHAAELTTTAVIDFSRWRVLVLRDGPGRLRAVRPAQGRWLGTTFEFSFAAQRACSGGQPPDWRDMVDSIDTDGLLLPRAAVVRLIRQRNVRCPEVP